MPAESTDLKQQLKDAKNQALQPNPAPSTLSCLLAGCQLALVMQQRDAALSYQKQAASEVHQMVITPTPI